MFGSRREASGFPRTRQRDSRAARAPRRRRPVPVRAATSREVRAHAAPAAVRQSITGCARLIARPSGTRGTAARKCGSAAAIAASIRASKPGTARTASTATWAARSAELVTPSVACSCASCSIETAPDSKSQRRSAGRSATADSRSTQPPASYMWRSRVNSAGLASGGGSASSGPRAASESTCCERTMAAASAKSPASAASPRMAATAARSSSVWGRPAGVAAPDLSGAIASLSARLARAPTVSAPPWFRSADSRPATPRCRP